MTNQQRKSENEVTDHASSNSSIPLPAHRSPLPDKLNSLIDHTFLKPEATLSDINRLCHEALEYQFAVVCVHGSWVNHCSERLAGSKVKVCTVAGFPSGAETSRVKALETQELVDIGAQEIDMVAPVGRILSEEWSYVFEDIGGVVEAAGDSVVKVILETAVLSPNLIVKASEIAVDAGAKFVKTSTGLHPKGGATVEAVTLMSATVGNRIGVKAAGGIRDCSAALRMIAAGASRIGTSSGVLIAEKAGDQSLVELLSTSESD